MTNEARNILKGGGSFGEAVAHDRKVAPRSRNELAYSHRKEA